jgi:Putative adhesin
MPTFNTPEPIAARVEAAAGSVRFVATDRDDTVVEVRAHDESRAADVRAAELARVQCHNGKLTAAAGRGGFPLFRGGAIDIDIALPSRSTLTVSVTSADVCAEGEFDDCQISSASGNLNVDAVQGNLKATTASGSITVQAVTGNVSVATASGNTTIGQLDGDLKFKAASGDLGVEHLRGHVGMQTASGSVTVATAVRGAVSVSTASGDVGVGVAEGTAARLDLTTASGAVSNTLEAADGPAEGDDTLLIRVRTASGDIDIHRAVPTHSAANG